MDISSTAGAERIDRRRSPAGSLAADLAGRSAVSWGAVVAGAAAAASLSLILLILGVGLGLSSVSPWAREGANTATIGLSTILWLSLTQVLASAMGGYLAGRLRARWTEVHADEVYFRDTAHGFLAWAVASLATAALLGSVIASIVGGGAQAGVSMAAIGTASVAAAGSAGGAQGPGPMGYFVDTLFRPVAANAEPLASVSAASAQAGASDKDTAEVGRIFMNASHAQPLPAEDIRYVGQIVAKRTGLSQQDAEKRVSDVYTRVQAKLNDAEVAMREAADKARKASAYSALWLFVSLLVGAFVASLAATFGGRLRDA